MDKIRYFIIGSFVIIVSFIFIIVACSQLLANNKLNFENINFLNSNSKASEGFNTFADVMENGINYINNKDNYNGISPHDKAFIDQLMIRIKQNSDQQMKDAIRQAEWQRRWNELNNYP